MSEMSGHVEDAAKQCAGNHRKFDSFGWSKEPEDHENWMIFNTSSRDSDLIEESNEYVFLRTLFQDKEGNAPFGDDVVSERHSHWGFGYFDCLVIRVYKECDEDTSEDEKEITEAFTAWHELACALSDDPVLDSMDYSERLTAKQKGLIETQAPSFGDHEEPKEWIDEVFGWLWDNNQECSLFNYSDEPWVNTEEISEAFDTLGIKYGDG